MGAVQSSTLNQGGTTLTETSAYHEDRGDGTPGWVIYDKVADGGDVALGSTGDAAITNPATDGTLIAFVRGLLSVTSTVSTTLASILTKLTSGAASVTKLEDAAHASGDAGVMSLAVRRDTAAASSGTTGDYEPLQTDSSGRLRTLVKRDPADALSIASTSALAASLVVKASAGTLHSIVGSVKVGQDGWIQVHNVTSLPADGVVPTLSVFVGAASTDQSVNIPLPGHVCSTGIVVVWSTTQATKTLGAANLMISGYYE